MTLTYKVDLDKVQLNQHAKCLDRFIHKLLSASTHTHTHTRGAIRVLYLDHHSGRYNESTDETTSHAASTSTR